MTKRNGRYCKNKQFVSSSMCRGIQSIYGLVGIAFVLVALSTTSMAQLEEIIVTAQKRSESLQDVPVSVTTMTGDELSSMLDAGGDILTLAAKVPGLYAESSNGRLAPRFYLRGLGNTDFDLAASQPVSIVMDDVVMENVILKSFPLFDLDRIEIIRGPQGTLFGRNTTAGIVKFDSRRPTEETEGYISVSVGELGTQDVEGAVSGSLAERLTGRLSVLSQSRDDWITNLFVDENNPFQTGSKLGGFTDNAIRVQLQWAPTDDFTALFLAQTREMDGTASIFRANVFDVGSNDFNENFVRDEVYFDQGDNNPQGIESNGYTLKIDWNFDEITLTSISSYQDANDFSRGDIDGGARNADGTTVPGFIPFDAVTEDQAITDQITQEIRFSSNYAGPFNWQAGAFYFDSDLDVTTIDGFFGRTTVTYTNETWAVFGQGSYDVSDRLRLIGGLRFTDDEKTLSVGEQNVDGLALAIGAASVQDIAPVSSEDDALSWEFSANYSFENSSIFARASNGFRAQTIRGRTIAFEGDVSSAENETITSFDIGFKSDFLNDTLRLNLDIYYYTIDDIQLTGLAQSTDQSDSLFNADEAVGSGVTLDFTFAPTERLLVKAGYGYTDTELQDEDLSVGTCRICTVTNPLDSTGRALIDGNRLERSPLWTGNLSVRYAWPVSTGEIYAFTDWAIQGRTHIQAFRAVELVQDNQFEGGFRLGYINDDRNYEVAVFGRNITDEENVKGALTFNNMTGFSNEPRIWGVEARYHW